MYVLPALLFVLAFTVYPFIHMIRVSLNDWTLITPPEYVGLDNFSGPSTTTSSGDRCASR